MTDLQLLNLGELIITANINNIDSISLTRNYSLSICSENIARNELTGTMPMLSIEKKDVDGGPSDDCSSFPNPFIKIGISWVQQQQKTDKEPFGSIKTLSLREFFITHLHV